MNSETPGKLNQTEKTRNEVILQFLNNDSKQVKESVESKFKVLVMENIQLRQQIRNRAFKTNEVLAHNHKIVSIIAHDLRSPYNTVLGTLDFLRMNSASMSQEVLSSYFDLITNTTNNTLDLLDYLLDWTTLNKSSKKFNPTLFNLQHLVMGVLRNLEAIAEIKEINVVNNITSHIVVIADRNMLATIIRNLVTNAIQYNHQNGEVIISSNFNNDQLEVEIADTGRGINTELLDALSDKLNSESLTACFNDSRKGLGLMFCKEFVGMHGGDLKIESRENIGTTVRFTIPSADYFT